MSTLTNEQRYEILTKPTLQVRGHKIDITDMYGSIEGFEEGFYHWVSDSTHSDKGTTETETESTSTVNNEFDIFYRKMGVSTNSPPILMLHGVPTNLNQYTEIQRYLSRFFRTISIDMMGMGKSSKPLSYKSNFAQEDEEGNLIESTRENPWLWKYDAEYIYKIMSDLYPNDEKFIFIADDWGAGIALTYSCSESYKATVSHLFLIDPIYADGYPVNEIQAIGRLSGLDDSTFKMMAAGFDQTVVQILKSMVHDPSKFDQFNLRDFMFPYVKSDYTTMPQLNSKTMILNFDAIRVLANRSAILSPSLLLPKTEENPQGIDYDGLQANMSIIWGAQDNMMPSIQAQTFRTVFDNGIVSINYIENAGHFAGIDQPERVTEVIINKIQELYGPELLAQPFFGLHGILKGSEFDQRDLLMSYKYS